IPYAFCLLGLFAIKAPGDTEFAFAEGANPQESPWWMNRIDIWAAGAIVLMIVAYAGPVWQHFHEGTIYLVPGMRTW
ncbi:MAG: hypothetical protein JO175_10640, partial [Candidatus Eremiobacteraeota bacterium]|nr:hypothetical protein [Candidatus Eremiobacteraeota bacterium]